MNPDLSTQLKACTSRAELERFAADHPVELRMDKELHDLFATMMFRYKFGHEPLVIKDTETFTDLF